MEAATLPKKKSISKGKIKKTLRNVLCRPDELFWPLLSEEHTNKLSKALDVHKIDIPVFKKLHWKELKQIPKKERPKPPKLKKIDGLLFGISECREALKSKTCAAIIIEASVNPRIIVNPIIEACIESRVPVVCVNNLRQFSANNFGIPTSCLGLKCDHLTELRDQVLSIAKFYEVPKTEQPIEQENIAPASNLEGITEADTNQTAFSYLYRTDKSTRAFIPSGNKSKSTNFSQGFQGQNFIEFSENPPIKKDRKSYMNMILKKISNNPNRVKVKN